MPKCDYCDGAVEDYPDMWHYEFKNDKYEIYNEGYFCTEGCMFRCLLIEILGKKLKNETTVYLCIDEDEEK